MTRKWYFSVENFDEDYVIEFVGWDGEIVDVEAAKADPFVGTEEETDREAERRVELWRERYDLAVTKVMSHEVK